MGQAKRQKNVTRFDATRRNHLSVRAESDQFEVTEQLGALGESKKANFPQDRQLDPQAVAADIDVILWSLRLQNIRRYFRQRYWEKETTDSKYADLVEPGLKLENVAAHSWHVADTVLLLAGHFPTIDVGHCLALAILHDKLEIITGDISPIGRDGTGQKTHAFNDYARARKDSAETAACEIYASRLRPTAREGQARLFREIADSSTPEARFVKAIDKLQSLAFVHLKKDGSMSDNHFRFTIRYSSKCPLLFSGLGAHYIQLRELVLSRVAQVRGCSPSDLEELLLAQLELDL